MAKQQEEGAKRKYTKQVVWSLVIFTGPVWGLALALYLTSLGAFGKLPSIEQIANPDTKLATEIITEDGEVLGPFSVKTELQQPTMKSLPTSSTH